MLAASVAPGTPSDLNLFSEQPSLLELWLLSHCFQAPDFRCSFLLATQTQAPPEGFALVDSAVEGGARVLGGVGVTFQARGVPPGRGELIPALCLGCLVCEMGVKTVPNVGISLSKEQVALRVCHDKGERVDDNA